MTTVAASLRAAALKLGQSATPMLDARVLMKAALSLDDAGLIAISDRALTGDERSSFEAMVERRRRHEPVAHIVGRREFWSLDIEVAPGILVPRSDSETLIEAIVARRSADASLRILDLGCGSGALLCALLSAFPDAEGLGVDIDPKAVALTARNLWRLGLGDRAEAREGDWFEGIDGRFDAIVANPPYIRTLDRDTLPREVAGYEAALALFAGEDGLDAHRRIFSAAPGRLSSGGLLVVEFGEAQEIAVKDLARKAFPAAEIGVVFDLGGRARATVIDLRD